MKPWQFAVAGLACLAAAGCQTDPKVLLLERQNRMLEDEVYRLRAENEDLRAGYGPCVLDDEPAPTPARRRQTIGAEPEGGPSLDEEFSETPGEPMSPEEFRRRFGPPQESPPLDLPNVPDDGHAPTDRDAREPLAPDAEELDEAPPFRPMSAASIRTGDSRLAERLVLNGEFTGGYNADGQPGDEGITVVLEPRDGRGRPLHAAADVSIVVLDRALPGDQARVARWDFTAAEIAAVLKTTGPGLGIALNLRWPAGPPVNRDLHVFVRYTTSDGRKLQADQPIRIELPGQGSPGWVPTEPQGPELQLGRRSEPRPLPGTPTVQLPATPTPRTAERPQKSQLQRPVWSPYRP